MLLSKSFLPCNVLLCSIPYILRSRINIISQVQYDIESIYRCYVASKTSYYYYFLYHNDLNRVSYYN